MSIYAFGDIHGENNKLTTLLDAIKPKKTDTLVFLGDMIDRGIDSKGVLDTIIHYQEICQVISILGNHEQMLLDAYLNIGDRDALDFWLRYGGDNTLWSFGLSDDLHGLLKIPRIYIDWLKSCYSYYQTQNFIFTHATPKPNIAMEKQDDVGLRWRFLDRNDKAHISGKTIVCGHSTQKNAQVYQHKGLVCIDTYAYGDGCLTALQIPETQGDNLTVWQTSGQFDYSVTPLMLI